MNMILRHALPLRNGGGRDAYGFGDPGNRHTLAEHPIKNCVSVHVDMLSMAKNDKASLFLSAANLCAFYNHFMEIGDRIKRERRAAGLTQEQLAKRVGVNKSAVAQWESPASRKGITSPNLVRVADALAIPVTRLTGDAGPDRLETEMPDEIALVRLFRRMGPGQQRVHLNLFYSSVGLAHPEEPERDPTEGRRVATGRAIKQKT